MNKGTNMEKYHKRIVITTMLICFIVYGTLMVIKINNINQRFHSDAHEIVKVYAELVTIALERTNTDDDKDIFETQLIPVDKNTFQIDFCDKNYALTNEYFDKIGSGKYQRYYSTYKDSKWLFMIQEISDAFLQDHKIEFIVCADINGYNFAHHKINSQRVTGDWEKDKKISRHHRKWSMFSILSLKKYYTDKNYFKYTRDTGEVLAVTAVPIYVYGKHWGSAAIAYKFIDFNARMFQGVIQFIMATFLAGTFLLLLLPRVLRKFKIERIKNFKV